MLTGNQREDENCNSLSVHLDDLRVLFPAFKVFLGVTFEFIISHFLYFLFGSFKDKRSALHLFVAQQQLYSTSGQ